jgi:alpha-beta hydrolase superfamily lysophospholipase
MAITSFSLDASADGLKLEGLLSLPDTGTPAPRGIIQMVHGMCEHKERYIPLMEFFTAHGLICVIHDNRGHGASVKSPEDLGYMYDGGWQAMVEDVRVVNDWIHAQYPDLKIILYGHSMGSMIVRSFIKKYDDRIAALIVSGCPVDNPAKAAGKAMAWAFGRSKGWHYRPQLLQKMSFGAYSKPFIAEDGPMGWVCSNPDILKSYSEDPLCQYVFTANGFYNLLGLMQDCYSRKGWSVNNPGLPIHFMSGEQDPCRGSDAQFRKAVRLLPEVGYYNVTAQVYPDMRHEIHNETGCERVWNDLLFFIDNTLDPLNE